FQWRKSRGSSEKFHGAVIDHCGHEHTRVFNDVKSVGDLLTKMDKVVGTSVEPQVAVIYDWENFWAMYDAQGPRKHKKDYFDTCVKHYEGFYNQSIPVDVINMDCDFTKYDVVIAPMLYMVRKGVGERLTEFVKNGGTLITTYWSGIVDESDLCFLGGFPGALKEVTGVWAEELDTLYDNDVNIVKCVDNELNLKGEYNATIFCDLIHAETAKVMAKYDSDFYKGMPALTCNEYGKGKAYYMAFRNNEEFLKDFYKALAEQLNLKKSVDGNLPCGVNAQMRYDDENKFAFLMNFTPDSKTVELAKGKYINMDTNKQVDSLELEPYDFVALEEVR
ncbi:MAG: beta-galactosidase trimerization domain-containing protein, partial [Oscillospiraceae bacterium]